VVAGRTRARLGRPRRQG